MECPFYGDFQKYQVSFMNSLAMLIVLLGMKCVSGVLRVTRNRNGWLRYRIHALERLRMCTLEIITCCGFRG